MTCWRRLRDWQAQGVWDRLHLALLTKLRQHDQIDWSRASIDAAQRSQPTGRPRNRPQSHRPGKAWQQAAHHRRSSYWRAIGAGHYQGQPSRLDCLRSGWLCASRHPWLGPGKAITTSCGQRVTTIAAARHTGTTSRNEITRRGVKAVTAWPTPLGGGAQYGFCGLWEMRIRFEDADWTHYACKLACSFDLFEFIDGFWQL